MVFTDYYAESTADTLAYNVGKGARNVANVVQTINPLKAVGAVMLVWGAVAGAVNYRRYKKGEITKKQAIAITASESVGMGLSAGLGLLADGMLGTFVLTTTAPSVFALTVGVVVTSGAKIAWNCATKNNEIWCDANVPEKVRRKAAGLSAA